MAGEASGYSQWSMQQKLPADAENQAARVAFCDGADMA